MAAGRWVFLSLLSGMLLGYGLGLLTPKPTKVETPSRFQIQQTDENKIKICDTQNGNTISIVYNEGYEFQISAQENCKEIPAK